MMNEIEALKELKNGKKIRCKSWPKGIYLQIKGNIVKIHLATNADIEFIIENQMENLTKDKWEVVK